MVRVDLSIVAGLVWSVANAVRTNEKHSSGMKEVYSFADVPPSSNLEWVRCYHGLHCANLVVPLDYAHQELGTTIVAFIRRDPVNPTGQYLLFNPGGPGTSGIVNILADGGDQVLAHTGGEHSIVSFDPRGVNNSGIALTCLPGNRSAANDFFNQDLDDDLSKRYDKYVAYGQHCSEANTNADIKYASTFAVVQDLIHFTELQASLDGHKNPKEAEISFYGVSYGTSIAHTLAATYPERVGRIIADGNCNTVNRNNGLDTQALLNTDDAAGWFFRLCYEAGPVKCALHDKATSPADVKSRFDRFIQQLSKVPMRFTDTRNNSTIKIDGASLKFIFTSLLYYPQTFGEFAQAIHDLSNSDPTLILSLQDFLNGSDPGPRHYDNIAEAEATMLISAIDSAGRYPIHTVEDYLKVAQVQEAMSQYDGRAYAETNDLFVAGFSIKPPKSQFFQGFKRVSTANKLLFINNVADPFTPLASAKYMSQFFEGSVVLTRNTVGHTSFTVASTCTQGYIAAYLKNGTLPRAGTVCDTDYIPLVDDPVDEKLPKTLLPRPKKRPSSKHGGGV